VKKETVQLLVYYKSTFTSTPLKIIYTWRHELASKLGQT
jgi:hypothetical protein